MEPTLLTPRSGAVDDETRIASAEHDKSAALPGSVPNVSGQADQSSSGADVPVKREDSVPVGLLKSSSGARNPLARLKHAASVLNVLTKNKSKVSISDEAAALQGDTESLPACTLWVGGIPSSAANMASITQACEGIAGPKCVSRVTVRIKPSDVARTHKSWALVTMKDAEAMAHVLDTDMVVEADNGEMVTLKTSLPKSRGGVVQGAMAAVVRQHKARSMWGKLAKNHNKKIANRVAAHIPNAGSALLMESVKRLTASKRKCFYLPTSRFLQAWHTSQVIALLYVAIVFPLDQGFGFAVVVYSFRFWVDAVVDVWFILDVLVNFRTSFEITEGSNRGKLEISRKVIARRYLQGWFTVDVLSCLPINYVEYIWSTNDLGINPKLLKVVRLLRLSRLLKLTKFVKILEMYEDTSVRDWLDRMRMLFFVVCILWYTHLLACTWYFTGSFSQTIGAYTLPGWVEHEFSLTKLYSEQNISTWRKYAYSYHAVNAKMFDMAENHGGDWTTEMLVVGIVLEMVGVVLFGAVVGSISHIIVNGSKGEQDYHETMELLRTFFTTNGLPYTTRRKVRGFYENLFVDKVVFDHNKLLAPLPPHLSQEVVMSMYKDLIANTPLFNGLDDQVTTMLCTAMRPEHMTPGTKLMREGEVGDEMYILIEGEVLITKGGAHGEVREAVIHPGATLGEMAMINAGKGSGGNRRSRTATCITDCETCFISRARLNRLMQEYPSLEARIEQMCTTKIQEDGWQARTPKARRERSRPESDEEASEQTGAEEGESKRRWVLSVGDVEHTCGDKSARPNAEKGPSPLSVAQPSTEDNDGQPAKTSEPSTTTATAAQRGRMSTSAVIATHSRPEADTESAEESPRQKRRPRMDTAYAMASHGKGPELTPHKMTGAAPAQQPPPSPAIRSRMTSEEVLAQHSSVDAAPPQEREEEKRSRPRLSTAQVVAAHGAEPEDTPRTLQELLSERREEKDRSASKLSEVTDRDEPASTRRLSSGGEKQSCLGAAARAKVLDTLQEMRAEESRRRGVLGAMMHQMELMEHKLMLQARQAKRTQSGYRELE